MNSNLRNLLKGDRRAMSRLISNSEDLPEKATKIVNSIFQYTGRAYIIGITGPQGCGKSTLVEKLALEIRKNGKKVGIIAIDPSSPFSGGVFMGNRLRMRKLLRILEYLHTGESDSSITQTIPFLITSIITHYTV